MTITEIHEFEKVLMHCFLNDVYVTLKSDNIPERSVFGFRYLILNTRLMSENCDLSIKTHVRLKCSNFPSTPIQVPSDDVIFPTYLKNK